MFVLMMVIFTEQILNGKLDFFCSAVGYVLHIVRFIIEVPGLFQGRSMIMMAWELRMLADLIKLKVDSKFWHP